MRSCSNSAGGSPEGTGGVTIAFLQSDRHDGPEADDPYGDEEVADPALAERALARERSSHARTLVLAGAALFVQDTLLLLRHERPCACR